MQFKVFASLSCLLGMIYVHTVEGQIAAASLAVIVIAGLAIAKEKLIAAEIHRNYITRKPVTSYGHEESGYGLKRGKRQADADAFAALFDSALELDTDDCAKKMVCYVFEKPVEKLNAFEVKIYKLFADDLKNIDGSSSKVEYQKAAFTGSLKQPGLCQERYAKCLTSPEALTAIAL